MQNISYIGLARVGGGISMLRLEWMARLFAIIITVLVGIFLGPSLLVCCLYALFLLFKKYTYPWTLGSYYNAMIEAVEIAALLYIHAASSSALVSVLFLSFIVRMVLVYDIKVFLPVNILISVLFIQVDYYITGSHLGTNGIYRAIYWVTGFGFLNWILWDFHSFVKYLEESQQKLKDTIGIKDILIKELNQSRKELLESNDELYIWANTDPLTGLYNSRYFNRYWDNLAEQFSQIKQNNYPVALVLIDIQGHRIYNDVYGHAAGDILIQDLVAIIRECAEAEDILVRYSDYVFSVIIPGQQEAEAIKFYHRFKNQVKEYSQANPGMRNIEVFIGWACCHDIVEETKEDLINRAIKSMRIIN